MSKAAYLQEKKLNLADELRTILTHLEALQVGLKAMNPQQVINLLNSLDQAALLFQQISPSGINLLSEQGRFEAIQARLKRDAALLVKRVGGPSGLTKVRPSPAPPTEHWWWYIQEIVATQRQQRYRKLAIGLGSALLIIGVIALAFRTVLAPTPEAVARFEAETGASSAIDQQDFQEALRAIEGGLTKAPEDASLLIFKGVLQQKLGRKDQAQTTFDQALSQLEDDVLLFYLTRSQLHLQVGQPQLAEHDARLIIEQDETIGRAWLLLGHALQAQERIDEAVPAFEQASKIAFEQGDDEVVVLARLALGQLTLTPQ